MSTTQLDPVAPAAEPTPTRAGGDRRVESMCVVLTLAALGAWVASLGHVDVRQMNDLGLVSVLPWTFWCAVVLATGAFVAALLLTPFRHTYAAATTGVLVLLVYATPAAVEGTPRLEAVYRHLGISNQIAHLGIDRNVDAYFNWPGLFSALAMFGQASGVHDLFWLATLAPVLVATAYVPPLLLLLRALAPDPRLGWLGVGLFEILNWTGQDYLSPQAFTFWLYLAILGVVITVAQSRVVVLPKRSALRRYFPLLDLDPDRARAQRLSDVQFGVAMAVVMACIVAINASHQLTPFALALVLGLLWLSGRIPYWWLPWAAGLVTVVWLAWPAEPFVSGNIGVFTGQAASPATEDAAGAGILARIASGSLQHQLVVFGRLGQAAVVWGMALLGAFVLRRRGIKVSGPLFVVFGTMVLVPLQAYGGEMLIRVYLFGLAFAAFLVAGFLEGPLRRGRRGSATFLAVVLALLLSGNVLTRYGNERGESFTRGEIRAAGWIYDQRDPQATIVAVTSTTPWRFRRYSTIDHVYAEQSEPGARWTTPFVEEDVLKEVRGAQTPVVYVLWTRSQTAMAELGDNTKPGSVERVTRELLHDPQFEVVFRDRDGFVLRWLGGPL